MNQVDLDETLESADAAWQRARDAYRNARLATVGGVVLVALVLCTYGVGGAWTAVLPAALFVGVRIERRRALVALAHRNAVVASVARNEQAQWEAIRVRLAQGKFQANGAWQPENPKDAA